MKLFKLTIVTIFFCISNLAHAIPVTYKLNGWAGTSPDSPFTSPMDITGTLVMDDTPIITTGMDPFTGETINTSADFNVISAELIISDSSSGFSFTVAITGGYLAYDLLSLSDDTLHGSGFILEGDGFNIVDGTPDPAFIDQADPLLADFLRYHAVVGGTFWDKYGIEAIGFDATTVPAPASLLLFGLGLAGIGIFRRKKT